MKNTTKLLMLVAVSLTVLNACKKKEDKPVTPTKPTGIMMAKLDGKAWQSDPESSFKIVDGDTLRGTMFQMSKDTLTMFATRLSDTSTIFGYFVLKQPRVGTYTGNGTVGGVMLYVKPFTLLNLLMSFQAYSFNYTLNITKFDDASRKISGTYTLNMTSNVGGPAINVTEGEFTDVVYKQVP